MKTFILSDFENRVYCLVVRGLSNKQMAKRLNVNEVSIRSAWRRIVNKADLKKKSQDNGINW